MEIDNKVRFLSDITTQQATASLKEAGDKSFEEKLKSALEKNDDKELKAACKQFEGIMLNMLYRQMKATIIRSNLVEADAARDIFESMLDESLMEKASEASTFGLADSLYKQLSRKKPASVSAGEELTAKGDSPVEE